MCLLHGRRGLVRGGDGGGQGGEERWLDNGGRRAGGRRVLGRNAPLTRMGVRRSRSNIGCRRRYDSLFLQS